MAYGYGYDDGILTEEQREYERRRRPDTVGTNQRLARQFAQANALRTPMPRGMDWASQATRALQGAWGGKQQFEAEREHKQLRDAYGGFLRDYPGRAQRVAAPSALPFMGANDAYGEGAPSFLQQQTAGFAPTMPGQTAPGRRMRMPWDEDYPPELTMGGYGYT